MARKNAPQFSRRERQIMEILYRLGSASVAEVLEQMPEKTTYDSVRLTLGVLGDKGQVNFHKNGRRYVYRPVVPHDDASRSAAQNLLRTYFRGSPSQAILAVLDVSPSDLSDDELDEIESLVRQAKEKRER